MRAGADVEDFARNIGLGRGYEGARHVGHEDEIARLRAVANHREGLAGELLREEDAEHCAVGAGGPAARAIDVEQAERDDRQAVDLAPVQRHLLADIFR